ncbi:hypothetical protein [Pontibacter locisalis]
MSSAPKVRAGKQVTFTAVVGLFPGLIGARLTQDVLTNPLH